MGKLGDQHVSLSGRPTVAILVPWRSDDGPRAKVWKVCRARWEALFPDWPVFEGRSPEGPFNRSAALNDAKRQAGERDVYLAIDADVMLRPQNVRAAVERAFETGKVTWAHRRWRGITQEATERLIRPDPKYAEGALGTGGIERSDFSDADLDLIIEKTTRMSWSCCIAIRTDAWETIGGFDERFMGWGFEDLAFQAAAARVGWDRIEGDVINFYHPRVPGAGRADKTGSAYTAQALVNGRLGMRYMVALRRDYRLTDRPDPADDAEIERDIGNLIRQDEEFAKDQHPLERRVWDGWWPTLEELRAGALDMSLGPVAADPTVTVVVTSGGKPEMADIRLPLLDESLASLNARLVGPIVQRVVYSDWPDEFRPRVEEIAARHGFYVAGEGHHGHTRMRQRLWLYLSRHAHGEFIFGAEDDFAYDRDVDLSDMIRVLRSQPQLVQMALLRDACYPDERDTEAIGNILGWPRPAFEFHDEWFSHRLLWTNNPSLFRRSLTAVPWPDSQEHPVTGRGDGSEVVFWKTIKNRDHRVRSGYWGTGDSWVRHLATGLRAGVGY